MSLTPAQLLRGLAVLACLVAWAVLAHLGSAGEGHADLATALGVAPLIAVAVMLLWQTVDRRLMLAGVALSIGAIAWLWPSLRQNVALLYYVQHIGTNLALAVFFGRTLFGGQISLVTRFARMAHNGVISPAMERYTRQVTMAWTLFFLGISSVSTLLFWLAPAAAWSVFANLLSTPLIGLMFVGEHICRHLVLAPEDRSSIADTIRGYRNTMQQRAETRSDHP
jgi:uncharacterized membrane protein